MYIYCIGINNIYVTGKAQGSKMWKEERGRMWLLHNRILQTKEIILQAKTTVIFTYWQWKASLASDVLFVNLQLLFSMQALNASHRLEPAGARPHGWGMLVKGFFKNGLSLNSYDQAVLSEWKVKPSLSSQLNYLTWSW